MGDTTIVDISHMSYQKFTKDVGIIGFTELIKALKGIVLLPIITKLLGAENYGIWAQLIVTLSLITPIATLGLPFALVRFLTAEKDKKEIQERIWSVLILIFIIASFIAIPLIIFSFHISKFFGGDKMLVQILAFTIILECLNLVYLNLFRAFLKMGIYSCFKISLSLGEVGLIAVAVTCGYGLFGAVLSLLIIRLINFIIMSGIIIKKIGFNIPKFIKIKEYLSFSFPTVPSNISSWIVQSSDRYLINLLLGTIYVGYYVPAYVLGNSIHFFIMPLSFVLPAVLPKFYEENKIEEVKIYLKFSLKYFMLIGIPSVFGLSVLSKKLLIIFTITEIAKQSYFIVPFVTLSILFFGIYTVFFQIIVLKKKTKIIGTIWLMAAIINFLFNFIFIPIIGILGAALTTLFTYFFALALTWRYSRNEFIFEINWKFILKSIFASLLMVTFIFWLNPTGLLEIIFTIIAGALFYGILIFLLKGISKQEINFFKKLFKEINV